MKVISDWHGGIETLNKANLLKAMESRENMAFIPGGFQDATCMVHGEHSTVMNKRKGFVKYALEHGYRLHPCYTFGESESFFTLSAFLKFRLWLNEFGIPAVLVFGNPWCPFLPRCSPEYYTYIGDAIELPKITKPSSADVDHWHGVYLSALEKLFENNKQAVGLPASAKLQVL